MSTFDYQSMADKVATLVERFGRAVKLGKIDADSAVGQPWRQEAAPTDTLVDAHAAFFPPIQGVRLGLSTEMTELLKRSTELLIISTPLDVNSYNYVLDGTRRLGINGAERLKVGDTTVMWYVSVKE